MNFLSHTTIQWCLLLLYLHVIICLALKTILFFIKEGKMIFHALPHQMQNPLFGVEENTIILISQIRKQVSPMGRKQHSQD